MPSRYPLAAYQLNDAGPLIARDIVQTMSSMTLPIRAPTRSTPMTKQKFNRRAVTGKHMSGMRDPLAVDVDTTQKMLAIRTDIPLFCGGWRSRSAYSNRTNAWRTGGRGPTPKSEFVILATWRTVTRTNRPLPVHQRKRFQRGQNVLRPSEDMRTTFIHDIDQIAERHQHHIVRAT